MRTFAVALLSAISSAKLLIIETDFVEYIAKYGKSYKDFEEYTFRNERFQATDEQIRKFNLYEKSSRHGHNFMSDFSQAEKDAMLGLKNMRAPTKSNKTMQVPKNLSLPTSVDWRNASPPVVNPVKDQGACGSCWAFASTAVMESAHAIFHGALVSLSEQNLVSCSFL